MEKKIFNFDNSYAKLPEELFSRVSPAKVKEAHLIVFNRELASSLGINTNVDLAGLTHLLSGDKTPHNAANIAQAYSGHQFGQFTNLGDGRAILLGEQLTPKGERYDLQLKGSGLTPYSRRGDGKATLSSMLREYIFSEALYALGVPSSRSLAVVATGEPVYREQVQEGAVLTRVAASHIRVGTFQYARQFTSEATQKDLTTYTINRHFPHLNNSATPALHLLEEVMQRQIELIIHWMRIGFIHGVMNTDNMLLSGESIDFGPCAFMNAYHPETVFSSIDHMGRYAFDKQASIALWNITRLAESLLPQIDSNTDKAVEKVKVVLSDFSSTFQNKYLNMMLRKIGIANPQSGDEQLINRLLSWMIRHKADYTNTFVQLAYQDVKLNKCFEEKDVKVWMTEWEDRLQEEGIAKAEALQVMQKNNPVYIPRNYLVENALKAVTSDGDDKLLHQLVSTISQAYTSHNFDKEYMAPPQDNYDFSYKTFCGT